ncbi:hypothetical protein DY000_02013115 [Brassica cretica]|uniref:RNase H type-1 domain-containing protein n=1 Tax=Brassica cretica TaxID=69181 RepID=A0ABQ7D0S0_BRACR|nr:hypothetical protein DY000_02013115 [Brassica cretica]
MRKIYEATEIVNKALEDWREWSQAQADVAPCEESSLLHSRSSFANVLSADDANAVGWLWAIESMCSLRKNIIVFMVEAADLLGAVLWPPAWPSFKWISQKINGSLNSVGFWKLELNTRKENLPAYLIAKSVVFENLPKSYVACGYPLWLSSFFV